MPNTPRPRPGGRTARTRTAVLQAASELLLEVPVSDLTVSQIADRAAVNETTIYRKWGTKDALLADVLLTLSSEQLVGPDTGTLRGDLIALVSAVAAFLRTPAGHALARLGATTQDESSRALRDTFWTDRFARARLLFDRARERGEVTDPAAADLAYEALIGTMHFRILGLRGTLDADIAERLVDLVLDGVLAPTGHSDDGSSTPPRAGG